MIRLLSDRSGRPLFQANAPYTESPTRCLSPVALSWFPSGTTGPNDPLVNAYVFETRQDMRKILSEDEFEKLGGKMIPLKRNTRIFDGDKYECCCGKTHTFQTGVTNVMFEGLDGRFLLLCDANPSRTFMVLIKTKMKFGLLYQGLELLGGLEIEPAET